MSEFKKESIEELINDAIDDFSNKWQSHEERNLGVSEYAEQINCELSELKSQRDEMLAMLEYLEKEYIFFNTDRNKVEQLIKKVKNE